MADRSKIEWTKATWNPIAGCDLVSPGCTNCYAMRRVAPRLSGNPATPHYAGTVKPSKAGPVWTGKIGIASDKVMTKPLRWKRPRMIFVNSTSDLFHPGVPDKVIDRAFAVMALSPQHTFQILTKRPERMRAYMNRRSASGHPAMLETIPVVRQLGLKNFPEIVMANWPLPNAWLGVSVEDQTRADERIPILLDTPAAIRWISAEPLLGPIDLFGDDMDGPLANGEPSQDEMSGPLGAHFVRYGSPRLDWVVAGGESGSGSRPMHPGWARQIRDQCAAADVPFLLKQWGEWVSAKGHPAHVEIGHVFDDGYQMVNVGKKAAGRELDGVTHDAFPASARRINRTTQSPSDCKTEEEDVRKRALRSAEEVRRHAPDPG